MVKNEQLKMVELLHNIILEVEFQKVRYLERYKKTVEDCIECNLINLYGDYEDQTYIINSCYSDLLKFIENNTYYKWYDYTYNVVIRNRVIIINILEVKN